MSSKPLLDYFFICSLDPKNSLADNLIVPKSEMNVWQSPAISLMALNASPLENGQFNDFQPKIPDLNDAREGSLSREEVSNLDPELFKSHPLDFKYESTVTHRYPLPSNEDDFPPHVHIFVHPNDMRLVWNESSEPPAKYHSFVITEENGTKSYGIVATVYEKLCTNYQKEMNAFLHRWRKANIGDEDYEYIRHIHEQQEQLLGQLLVYKNILELDPNLSTEMSSMIGELEEKSNIYSAILSPAQRTILSKADDVYLPKSYCILSHWPFYDFFKDWLAYFLLITRDEVLGQRGDIPLERYIMNLTHEIPVPPPGKLEIAVALGDIMLYLHRPPVNKIPLARNFSLFDLFQCLSCQNIVSMVECALAERKILFVSGNLALLNIAAESLLTLLYPFTWEYTYIPVLPEQLHGYLQAPVPFIVGIHGEATEVPDDVLLVDLDRDLLRGNKSLIPPVFPQTLRKRLMNRLRKHAIVPQEKLKTSGEIGHLYPFGTFILSMNSITSVAHNPNDLASAESLVEVLPMSIRIQNGSPLTPNSPVSNTPLSSLFGRVRGLSFSSNSKTETQSSENSMSSTVNSSINQIDSGSRPTLYALTKANTTSKSANRCDSITPTTPNAINGHAFYKTNTPTIACAFCSQTIPTCGFECKECKIMIHEECLIFQSIRPCVKFFNEHKIQRAFFRVFMTVLRNYKSYLRTDLIPKDDSNTEAQPAASLLRRASTTLEELIHTDGQFADSADVPDVWFDKAGFLNSVDKEIRVFLASLVETQAFMQFTLSRIIQTPKNDYETLFIDQSIIEMYTRGKFSSAKGATQFLNEESFYVNSTHYCLTALPFKYDRILNEWPLSFDSELYGIPRKIAPLLTSVDDNMMRAHTTQLLQRSAIQQNKNSDLKSWITSRFTTSKDEQLLLSVSQALDAVSKQVLSSVSNEEIDRTLIKLHEQHRVIDEILEMVEETYDLREINIVLFRLMDLISIYNELQRTRMEKMEQEERQDVVADRMSEFPGGNDPTKPDLISYSVHGSVQALNTRSQSILQIFGQDPDAPEKVLDVKEKDLQDTNFRTQIESIKYLQEANFEVAKVEEESIPSPDISNINIAEDIIVEDLIANHVLPKRVRSVYRSS